MSRTHDKRSPGSAELARAKLARRVLELDRAYPPEPGQEWAWIEIQPEQWNQLVALAKAAQPPKSRRET